MRVSARGFDSGAVCDKPSGGEILYNPGNHELLMKLRQVRTPPLIYTSPQNPTHKIPNTNSGLRGRNQK